MIMFPANEMFCCFVCCGFGLILGIYCFVLFFFFQLFQLLVSLAVLTLNSVGPPFYSKCFIRLIVMGLVEFNLV